MCVYVCYDAVYTSLVQILFYPIYSFRRAAANELGKCSANACVALFLHLSPDVLYLPRIYTHVLLRYYFHYYYIITVNNIIVSARVIR